MANVLAGRAPADVSVNSCADGRLQGEPLVCDLSLQRALINFGSLRALAVSQRSYFGQTQQGKPEEYFGT